MAGQGLRAKTTHGWRGGEADEGSEEACPRRTMLELLRQITTEPVP